MDGDLDLPWKCRLHRLLLCKPVKSGSDKSRDSFCPEWNPQARNSGMHRNRPQDIHDEFNLLHSPRHFRSPSRPDQYPNLKDAFRTLWDPSLPIGALTTSIFAGTDPQRRSHLGGATLVNFPSPSWSVSSLALALWLPEIYRGESNM